MIPIPENKAIQMLNKVMAMCYDCKTVATTCGMKCPSGVCKMQIADAKRICYAICDELIEDYTVEFTEQPDMLATSSWCFYQKQYWEHTKQFIKEI